MAPTAVPIRGAIITTFPVDESEPIDISPGNASPSRNIESDIESNVELNTPLPTKVEPVINIRV